MIKQLRATAAELEKASHAPLAEAQQEPGAWLAKRVSALGILVEQGWSCQHVMESVELLWPIIEALEVLTDLMDLPEEGNMTRQNAYTDYLWSQAYADLGVIDAAVTPAQDAFVRMKQIKSRVHLLRIAGLQGQLSQLDSKHIEVIRRAVMVNS